MDEVITIPIEIGDTVLGGKFKNKRIVVKTIGKNEKGDIAINGKPLMKYRLLQKEEKINEMDYEKLLPIQLSTIARIMGEMQMANRKGNSPTVKRLYKKLIGMIKILERTVTNL
jgi:spore coat protein CotF